MKRLVPVVAALTLIVAACGGGDDSTSDTTPADTAEPTEDAPSTEDAPTEEAVADTADETDTSDVADGSTTDETGDDDAGDDGTGDDETGDDDAGDDGTGDDDAGDDDARDDDGVSIQTIDDIPEECRDEMADFLRALEPIVSPVDWQSATMADFEQIANEFEAAAEDFELATGDAGCDELEFVDDGESEILIEFARSEAPGAVGFLEFVEQLSAGTTPLEEGATPEGIETCEDAIAFLQGLMDDYETMSVVPASDLLKIPSIAPLYAECTPEQLEFFDNPDLQDFMGG